MVKIKVASLVCLLLFFAGPGRFLGAETVQKNVSELIGSAEYRQAYNRLLEKPVAAENLFLRGYLQFKTEDYEGAEGYFRRVIEEYPDSERAADARYFIDRLNLYRPARREAPYIRVLLAEKNKISGVFTGRTLIKTNEEQFHVSEGEKWEAISSSAGVELVAAERGLEAEKILFIPAGAELKYDGDSYRGEFNLVSEGGRVLLLNELPLDKYLYGVIKKEIAPGWPLEPVKAQAVAARSFAFYYLQQNEEEPYDLGATWLAQVYGGKDAETEQVIEAVRTTRGEVLVYRGRVVPAYFHANSGGYIETAEDIWQGTRTDYIEPGPDTWSLQAQHSFWRNDIPPGDINEALAAEELPEIEDFGSLKISRRLPSGRAVEFQYRDRSGNFWTVRADKFRLAIGPEKLRSTWIDEIKVSSGSISFSGRGWGHGIGMSQWGAFRMGERGKNYREILEFYYSNAKLMGNYGFAATE